MSLFPPFENLGRRLSEGWRDRKLVLKAVSFALIGLVNTGVDFGVFSFGYFYLELPIVAANVMSWTVAVTNSYVLNSQITFAAESGRKFRFKDYLAFATVQCGGLIANTVTVVVASYFMPVLLGKLIATGASFLVDFSLSNFVVFRRRQSAPPH
jgi:putative flippase GtrA